MHDVWEVYAMKETRRENDKDYPNYQFVCVYSGDNKEKALLVAESEKIPVLNIF